MKYVVIFEPNIENAEKAFFGTYTFFRNLGADVAPYRNRLTMDVISADCCIDFRLADLDKCAGLRPDVVIFAKGVSQEFIDTYSYCARTELMFIQKGKE